MVVTQGSKDTSKSDEAAAKSEAAQARKAAAAKQLADEGGVVDAAPKKAAGMLKIC